MTSLEKNPTGAPGGKPCCDSQLEVSVRRFCNKKRKTIRYHFFYLLTSNHQIFSPPLGLNNLEIHHKTNLSNIPEERHETQIKRIIHLTKGPGLCCAARRCFSSTALPDILLCTKPCLSITVVPKGFRKTVCKLPEVLHTSTSSHISHPSHTSLHCFSSYEGLYIQLRL